MYQRRFKQLGRRKPASNLWTQQARREKGPLFALAHQLLSINEDFTTLMLTVYACYFFFIIKFMHVT